MTEYVLLYFVVTASKDGGNEFGIKSEVVRANENAGGLEKYGNPPMCIGYGSVNNEVTLTRTVSDSEPG